MFLYTKLTFKNLISNINSGISKRNKFVKVPFCNFNAKILDCLCRLGYIESYKIINTGIKLNFLVVFKFDVNGKQCLQKIRTIRYLDRQKNLRNNKSVFKGTWLVYTFDNILTDDEALIRDLVGIKFLLIV